MDKSNAENKQRKQNRFRYSIKKQFAGIFMLVLAGTIILCWLINNFWLEKYYINHKMHVLKKAYTTVNETAVNGDITSDAFDVELQKIISKYNIELLILDADTQTIKYSMSDPAFMTKQLLDRIFYQNVEQDTNSSILKKTSFYTIERGMEQRTKTEYLIMWGFLGNGNLFMLRTAVESIRDSVTISNQFLIYSGLFGILLGGVIIWIISRKITEPILQLSGISERMNHLDFEAKYTGNSHNEIGKLGYNINLLSDTLESTISELKTANNELRKDIARKEEIDEMRREFLSNVSHELKTPIALIQGYAEGLQYEIDSDAESREYYCSVIVDEAAKMNRMVRQLMSLNQLESGNDVTSMERFDIVELVRNYVQSADILIRQSRAEVTVSEEKPLFVWGDEFKVEEVVMNYFTNALHHVDFERKINIRFTKMEERGCVRISVFNTGKTIPEESMPRLWEKFYKVDKARTREYGGSGVGLSIVKAIMESMNQAYGVINYDNGVEFWFELEACAALESEKAKQETGSTGLERL